MSEVRTIEHYPPLNPTQENLHKALLLLNQVSLGSMDIRSFSGNIQRFNRRTMFQLLLSVDHIALSVCRLNDLIDLFSELSKVDLDLSIGGKLSWIADWSKGRLAKMEVR